MRIVENEHEEYFAEAFVAYHIGIRLPADLVRLIKKAIHLAGISSERSTNMRTTSFQSQLFA